MSSYSLPPRIPGYLRRLAAQYARTSPQRHDIIVASRVFVAEETGYDNLDGGMYGHTVRLYVPLEVLTKLDIDEQLESARSVAIDLRKLTNPSVDHEYIDAVVLEIEDEDDPECQKAIPYSARPTPNPDRLGIWKKGHIRVFISHRNQHRAMAHQLAGALDGFGFSCFVAHDTIPANEEWRRTIVNGLETMEVLLALITDDFNESVWTMQEIGYALGKGVPCVSVKLGTLDPPGFISEKQALRWLPSRSEDVVAELFTLLSKAVGRHERIQDAIVTAFVAAGDFNDARDRFDVMNNVVARLTDAQLAMIIDGYYRNNQLYGSVYLDSNYRRLVRFLQKATDKEFVIRGRVISETRPS